MQYETSTVNINKDIDIFLTITWLIIY